MKKLALPDLGDYFLNASHRVIMISYDNLFALSKDETLRTSQEKIRQVLRTLATNNKNQLAVISSRKKETLESFLSGLNITLLAEHGSHIKVPGKEWKTLFSNATTWKDKLIPSLIALETNYPGSFIEESSFSFFWHYWNVAEKVLIQKKQILAGFHSLTFSDEFIIEDHNYILEFRAKGLNRGKFFSQWLNTLPHFDFVLAIGSTKSDDEIFKLIDHPNFSVLIGHSMSSKANYYLDGLQETTESLHYLIELDKAKLMTN